MIDNSMHQVVMRRITVEVHPDMERFELNETLINEIKARTKRSHRAVIRQLVKLLDEADILYLTRCGIYEEKILRRDCPIKKRVLGYFRVDHLYNIYFVRIEDWNESDWIDSFVVPDTFAAGMDSMAKLKAAEERKREERNAKSKPSRYERRKVGSLDERRFQGLDPS
jgi:hypothetical protein